MSIYASQGYIGAAHSYLAEDEYQGPPPRQYQGSHVYPNPTLHRAARVDTAAIPHWCMPRHDDGGLHPDVTACTTCGADVDGDAAGLAPWLRLSIGDPAADMTIVMPAQAVRALRDELTDWLGRVWEVTDV